MIHLVNGVDAERHPLWIDRMHRLRARVFKDRLNWDVDVVEGRERDRFDDCNPLYLLSLDEKGDVQGTLRLLPTTGPNMLRDVFPQLLAVDETVESATIWESSRFAIDTDRSSPSSAGKVNRVTTELLCGLVEVGLLVGLSFIVSVFDARMLRVLRSAGYPPELVGQPQVIGTVKTYAGLFEVSERARQGIAVAGGLSTRVLARENDLPARAA